VVRNRFPESVWAERAIERITGLYRFRDGKPAFSRDSWSLAAGDLLRDVRAILVDPAGRLWLASDKTQSVAPFSPEGRMGPSYSARDLRGLTLTPGGELAVAAKTAVRFGADQIQTFEIPGEKKPDPLENITAALVLPGGDVLVADDKRKAVERFDSGYQYIGPFPDTRQREVSRLTRDLEGGIVMLDQKAKAIQVYSATGVAIRAIPFRGAGYELEEPRDVVVDPALRTYVADRKSATVSLFSPDGALLGSFGRSDLREPVALTLEPSGAVLVYDDKERQVIRFN
jgi:streptogramin lyase